MAWAFRRTDMNRVVGRRGIAGMRWFAALVTLAACSSGVSSQAPSTDWPQWRGQNRDGSVSGFIAPQTWPDRLNQRWKVEIGSGYATPLVVGNRVFMFTRQAENETMSALDPANGKV